MRAKKQNNDLGGLIPFLNKNRKAEKIILVFLLIMCSGLMVACVSKGIKRTSFKKWEKYEISDMGATIILPKKTLLKTTFSKQWKENPIKGWRTFRFCLHLYGNGHFLCEPYYFTEFSIERLSKNQYQDFEKGSLSIAKYGIYKKHHSEKYIQLKHFMWKDINRGMIYGWRKNYFVENGDVIVVSASYTPFSDWSDEIRVADSNAIERILNSIKIK